MGVEIKYIDNNPPNGELPRFAYVNYVFYPTPLDDSEWPEEDEPVELVLAKGEDFSAVGLVYLDADLYVENETVAREGDSLLVYIIENMISYGPNRCAALRIVKLGVDLESALEIADDLASELAGIKNELDNENFDADLDWNTLTLLESALMSRQLMRIDEGCMRVPVDTIVRSYVENYFNDEENE